MILFLIHPNLFWKKSLIFYVKVQNFQDTHLLKQDSPSLEIPHNYIVSTMSNDHCKIWSQFNSYFQQMLQDDIHIQYDYVSAAHKLWDHLHSCFVPIII